MGLLRRIREIITDHGTQFYANKRDKEDNAEHSFEQYLKFQGVKHILCRYNHPQSNGKVERWFQEYKKHRGDFPTLEDFICWYNNRPHGSHDLQTPEQVFWQRAQAHLLGFSQMGRKTKLKRTFYRTPQIWGCVQNGMKMYTGWKVRRLFMYETTGNSTCQYTNPLLSGQSRIWLCEP